MVVEKSKMTNIFKNSHTLLLCTKNIYFLIAQGGEGEYLENSWCIHQNIKHKFHERTGAKIVLIKQEYG